MNSCTFCDEVQKTKYLENEYAYAVYDLFPVNHGHTLIIPKRHTKGPFDLDPEEILAMYDLLNQCKKILDDEFQPDGYNIGINYGDAAGQTIFHLHLHVIPRYKDDVIKPKGGIRNFKDPLVEYPDF
ncbi:MAG: HIT family protein [Tindallia sp. MSAO_Bac2]|nr:MAG: HIT family protein [Tindallia sp. MSAO_Bac2]